MKRTLMLHEEYQDLTVFRMLEKMTGRFQQRQLFSYWCGERSVSVCYADFFRDVRRLAAHFDRLGLRGRRVVIDGRNTYEQLTALFAAMSMGAVAAPLCFDLELKDLRQLICRLEPALVIYDEEDEEIVPDIRLDAPAMACLGEKGVRGILDGDGPLYQDDGRTEPEQSALIQATSGSSSQPKLVVLPHRAVMPHGEQPSRRSIFVLPMYHAALSTLIVDMTNGVPSCLSSFRRAVSDIQWYRPEAVFGVPSFIALMLKREGMGTLDMGCFRAVTSGGAPQDPGTDAHLNARRIFSCSIYGTTETNGAITYSMPEHYRAGSVGEVGPWNEVRISSVGEVLVRGRNVMLGYLDDPEATGEALADGWYHTGDIGHVDEDGFLFITGRIKNIIVLSNGENISPEAVESKLSACEEVKEAVVLAENDQISAHIWCGDGRDQDREDRVRAFVARYNKTVPSYQAIRNIVFRGEPFPKTASGKIKR